MRARLDVLDGERRRGFSAAKGTVVPRPDLGTCPIVLTKLVEALKAREGSSDAVPLFDVLRWEKDNPDADQFVTAQRLGIAFADEVAKKPGPLHLLGKHGMPRKAAEALTKTEGAIDAELVIDLALEPTLTERDSFTPGTLLGRFYVWEYQSAKISCAANVIVSSSMKMTTRTHSQLSFTFERGLRSDLRERAIKSALDGLSIAGPPLLASTDAGTRSDALIAAPKVQATRH
jgi:hypothetical protein